jgi:hypothetical protein
MRTETGHEHGGGVTWGARQPRRAVRGNDNAPLMSSASSVDTANTAGGTASNVFSLMSSVVSAVMRSRERDSLHAHG